MTRGQIALLGIACLAGVLGWVLASDVATFFQSYLLGFLFWLDLSLGALAVLMIWCLTGGEWGAMLRGPLGAAARLMPLHAVLFIVLIPGLARLYSWWPAAGNSAVQLVVNKGWWLQREFFLLRAALYFVLWIAISWRWRNAWQQPRDEVASALRRWSAAGLIIYGFTTWLAGVDWIMSLEPRWVSSGFGLLYAAVQMLGAFAFGTWICMRQAEPPTAAVSNDAGNLLLTFLMMWMYLAFTQLLIIWSADLPQEILWYIPRLQTSWVRLTAFVVIAQFALPFALLLFRGIKRNPRRLGALALAVLMGQLLYTCLLVLPSLRPLGLRIHWSDPLLVIAIGALWGAAWTQGRHAGMKVHG